MTLANAPIETSGFALDEIDHIVLGEVDGAVEKGPLSPEDGAIAIALLAMYLNSGGTGSSAAARPNPKRCAG